MQYNVRVEKSDYDEYIKYVQRSLSARTYSPFWKNFVVWMVLGLVGVTAVNLLGIRAHLHIPTAFFVLTTFVLLYGFYFAQYRKKMAPDPDGFVLGERTYVVDDQGLREIRPHYESVTKWEGIVRLGESKDQVFLMLDKLAGYIIPTRQLSTTENEALRRFLKGKVANQAL